MKKRLLLFICSALFILNIFSHTAEEFIYTLSNPSVWSQKKWEFNEDLNTGRIIYKFLQLSGLNIIDIDFSGMDLKGINFNNCTFINVNFKNTNLSFVSLRNAILKNINLKDAKLEYADLECANLEEANLKNVSLKNTVLWGANLRKAILIGTDLTNAKLGDAQLQEAWLSETLQIPNYKESNELFERWFYAEKEDRVLYQKLVNAQFPMFKGVSNKYLKEIKWKEYSFNNADFSDCELEQIDLTDANLEDAFLYECNLQGSILRNVNLKNSCLFKANVENCDFTNANLIGALIDNIRLSKKIIFPLLCYKMTNEFIYKIHKEYTDSKSEILLKQILNARNKNN